MKRIVLVLDLVDLGEDACLEALDFVRRSATDPTVCGIAAGLKIKGLSSRFLSCSMEQIDGDLPTDAISFEDVCKKITGALSVLSPSHVARFYNDICSDQIKYLGDGIFEKK